MQIVTTVSGLGQSLVLLLLLSACPSRELFQSPRSTAQIEGDFGPRLHEVVTFSDRWIVSVDEAAQLIDQGAIVLDANGRTPNARSVTWQQFSHRQQPHKGNLLADDAQLTQQLRALGVSATRPVLVIGNPSKAWGEEGRIVWMLRSLGHGQAYMLDGDRKLLPPIPHQTEGPGHFEVTRSSRWTISQTDLHAQLHTSDLQIIDSREAREYHGKTPYGEARGGHIAGAKHLYFKALLHRDGRLLPYADLIARLEAAGIDRSKPVVVYCTGGIRSGWLTVVLVSLGYEAKNYPGSMWEWSASPARHFPLTDS